MDLFLATHNKDKIRELQFALKPSGINVLSSTDYPYEPPAETGHTFYDNALIKAQYALELTGLPALADDSGLCVDALDGAPGVDTANYGGYKKLLNALEGVPPAARTAQFHCCLVLCRPQQPPLSWSAVVSGTICQSPRAEDHGFGFDPVFIPENQPFTFSELPLTEKERIGHRGLALAAFLGWLGQQNQPLA